MNSTEKQDFLSEARYCVRYRAFFRHLDDETCVVEARKFFKTSADADGWLESHLSAQAPGIMSGWAKIYSLSDDWRRNMDLMADPGWVWAPSLDGQECVDTRQYHASALPHTEFSHDDMKLSNPDPRYLM